jgi:hypothetical protein
MMRAGLVQPTIIRLARQDPLKGQRIVREIGRKDDTRQARLTLVPQGVFFFLARLISSTSSIQKPELSEVFLKMSYFAVIGTLPGVSQEILSTDLWD